MPGPQEAGSHGQSEALCDRVNVIKRIKLGTKWPFAPVVEHNGRIVRDMSWSQAKTSTILKVAITWSGMKREGGGRLLDEQEWLQALRAKEE